jgi:hypothetical protein
MPANEGSGWLDRQCILPIEPPAEPALGVALPLMAALPGNDGFGQAGYRCPMAPSRLPFVLALALEIGTAISWIAKFGT